MSARMIDGQQAKGQDWFVNRPRNRFKSRIYRLPNELLFDILGWVTEGVDIYILWQSCYRFKQLVDSSNAWPRTYYDLKFMASFSKSMITNLSVRFSGSLILLKMDCLDIKDRVDKDRINKEQLGKYQIEKSRIAKNRKSSNGAASRRLQKTTPRGRLLLDFVRYMTNQAQDQYLQAITSIC
ncbi:hypothetical protein BJ170DRAFT_589816 [Xylariales sp. AK1849]|nr:hypothetical protein BJ170DRAFT_589816 [Xylariales sp. AK1849]